VVSGYDFVGERRKDLGVEGLAVFLALVGPLDFGNRLVLNQAELGRKLGMHRQSVQKAIKRLMGMGVLLEGPKNGQNRTYQLNPEMGWKGNSKNPEMARRKHRTQKAQAANLTGIVPTPEKDPQ
jgi:hypothetical protein